MVYHQIPCITSWWLRGGVSIERLSTKRSGFFSMPKTSDLLKAPWEVILYTSPKTNMTIDGKNTYIIFDRRYTFKGLGFFNCHVSFRKKLSGKVQLIEGTHHQLSYRNSSTTKPQDEEWLRGDFFFVTRKMPSQVESKIKHSTSRVR